MTGEPRMTRRFSLQTFVFIVSAVAVLSATTLTADFPQARRAAASLSADPLRIPASELAALVERDAAIVVDVRDPEMFRRGHLPGARLAPPELWREVGLELRTSSKAIVTYCSCPQEESSLRAAARFRELGVQNVRALTGGYEGWADTGRPVVTQQQRQQSQQPQPQQSG